MSMKDTVCRFAWDYPVLNVSRNELRFCCRAKSNRISEGDFKLGKSLFRTFIPIIDVRRDLLNGVKNENCSACWRIEAVGGKSPRANYESFLWFIKTSVWPELSYPEIYRKLENLTEAEKNLIIHTDRPRMIEISLGNTCDLKCVYCHHHYSSQWATERLKYKEIKPEEVEYELPKIKDTVYEDIWWDWFLTHGAFTTDTINFIGGEPLIIEKFYSYADKIINFYQTTNTSHPAIDISVVTNFNTPDRLYTNLESIAEKIVLSEKIKLDLNVSCESVGNRTEFIRTGSDWKQLTKNINRFLKFANTYDPDQKKIIFNLQIALNSLCISDLPNFFKFVVELQKTANRRINLRQNQVVYPEWCSPYVLPESYAQYVDDAIKVLEDAMKEFDVTLHSPFGRWDSYVTFLKTIGDGIKNPKKDLAARKSFAANIDTLCARRNIDFKGTFPEMIPFYEECKKL